jgi:hypothetical protein
MRSLSVILAVLHYLLGRRALARSDGIEVTSIRGRKKVLSYGSIKCCRVRGVRNLITVGSEKNEERFQRIVLFSDVPYAIKMTTESAASFLTHLRRHAPTMRIDTLPEKIREVTVFKK